MRYDSTVTTESSRYPGITFTTRRMSFGRRLELAARARDLGQALDFQRAGTSLGDRVAAALSVGSIDRMLLEWGLEQVSELEIDGVPATPAVCIERGPENLINEILAVIQAECGLGEQERKN